MPLTYKNQIYLQFFSKTETVIFKVIVHKYKVKKPLKGLCGALSNLAFYNLDKILCFIADKIKFGV